MTRRRYLGWAAAVLTLGLALRIGYIAIALRGRVYGLDSTWYFLQSGSIHDGLGFVDPGVRFSTGALRVTAAFPPLFPAWLAVWRWLGVDSIRTMQYLGTVPAAATIALTISIGRRVGGQRVGLVAGSVIALSPLAIAADGSLMSETLTMVCIALAVSLLVEQQRRGGWWRGAGAGLAIGTAMLTRADAVVVGVVVCIVVTAVTARRVSWRRGLLDGAVIGSCIAVVAVPWMVRNEASIDRFTMTTRSQWTAFAGANCADTYSGGLLGGWSHDCLHEERSLQRSEVDWADDLRDQGMRYVRSHAGRLVVVVVPMRIVRGFGLFHPWYEARIEAVETRHGGWQLFAIFVGFAATVSAVIGVWQLRRRDELGRATAWIVAAPIIASVLTVMVGHANTRFRVPAESSVAVAAAYAVVYWRPRRWVGLSRSTRRR